MTTLWNAISGRETHQQVLLAIAALGAILALVFSRRLLGAFRRYFGEDGDPTELAIFRLLLFGGLLFMPPRFHSLLDASPDLRAPLPGWGPIFEFIPFDRGVFSVAYWVFLAACVGAFVGFRTRFCAAIAALLGVYVHGVPQFYGKVIQYPHLLWFAALLAASPSGDVWSVDRLLRRRRGDAPAPGRSVAYALPLRFSWLLLGCVYLFPGLYKLWRLGHEWPASENMRNTLWMVWAERPDFLPPFRPDLHGWALALGGWGVVFFEIAYVAFVIPRRTRWFAALMAIAFHVTNGVIINILFWPLIICQLTLFPWARLFARARLGSAPEPRPWRLTAGIGTLLLALAVGCGAARIYSWPFTCYPCFDFRARADRVVLEIEAFAADGSKIPLDAKGAASLLDAARWHQIIRNAAKLPEGEARRREYLGIWELVSRDNPTAENAVRLRFVRVRQSIEPGHVGEEIARQTLEELSLSGR